MDVYDVYFRRADVDMDGRISGAEAVAFFQGSNLPKQILAQIWMYCDASKSGFLGRKEFYNALKLVTVSQRGQELTPEIVRAAMEGPISTKIPAPQINSSSLVTNPGNQTSTMPLVPSQNPGFRGPSNANMSQQFFPSGGQFFRPAQTAPAISSRPVTGQNLMSSNPSLPVSNTPNVLSDWGGIKMGGNSVSKFSTAPNTDTFSPVQSIQPSAKDLKTINSPGNGFNSVLGNDGTGALVSGMQTSFRPVQSAQTPISFSQLPGAQLSSIQNQNASVQINSIYSGPSSIPSGRPWPKFSQADVQKYSKLFMEVDTDKDGKITGQQARNLFLSWKLPREVLKQVWDLSDQDTDSMLSHREFVIALYLMERHREGHPLPAVLPDSVKFDETLLQATSASPVLQPNPGLSYQMMPGMRPVIPTPGVNSQARILVPQQMDAGVKTGQKQPRENLRREGNDTLNFNLRDEKDPREKEPEPENDFLDSKEKIEFYRSKMQELVLYKSKCDNRLNEITEKALADKREVELLAKKYDEKYKQVGELASKLAVDEVAFRDTQQKKIELHDAMATVERGGSVDGLLQVRANRIHADLEGLLKALNERCKKHSVEIKSTGILELPLGWEGGVQEGAAEWDEDWDKFEDEGFVLSKDQNNFILKRSAWTERSSMDDVSSVRSRNDDEESGKPNYAPSENGSTGYPSPRFGVLDASPRAVDSPSARSTISAGNFGDDTSWSAAFDMSNDTDSVSDFNTKESYGETRRDSFFGPGEFGLNPIKTGSPAASEFEGRERSPFFADSVPATPQFSYSSSPTFSEGPEFNRNFDSFRQFDSFSSTSSGLFPQRENLTRFDSIRSTSDQSQRFGFDDPDPFGYSGPFKIQDSNSSKQDSSKWSAF